MTPLGLVAGVRTQGLVWPFQEMHYCAAHVMVAYREKNGRIYTALTPKLVRVRVKSPFGRPRGQAEACNALILTLGVSLTEP